MKVHIMRGMNKLPMATRVQILSLLVEGSSLRSISRVAGVSINTVTKLLVDAGMVCATFHDNMVHDVQAKRVQCDEIWSFTYAKNKNLRTAKAAPEGAGDVWTWTGIDADSKLIVSWYAGDRHHGAGIRFMNDLRERLATRVQLTTDGHKAYLSAVKVLDFDADYAMLIKHFGPDVAGAGRYSPPVCIGTTKHTIRGNPDPKHISTSYAERQNLTMRMSMRRFTRLTNAFSKKFENHCHSLALYFVWYNWIRKHKAHGTTPAIAAGLTPTAMSMEDVVAMIDADEAKALAARRQAMLTAPQSN